jgi:hypothetical protein
LALEREKPLAPDQTILETYRIASVRMLKVFRAAVTPPLFPVALFGLLLAVPAVESRLSLAYMLSGARESTPVRGARTGSPRANGEFRDRARAWLFLAIVLAASAVALVRLHATGGYCTVRHGLVPGIILTLTAAHGLTWLMSRVSIPGRSLGRVHERLQPGPAVWAALIALVIVVPNLRPLGPVKPGPFSVYIRAADWLAHNTRSTERILDLTDWSVYFSQRPGYSFANVYEAPADPNMRWIVVRKPHVEGHWHYSQVVRALIGDRAPIALVPAEAGPNRVQIRIYDRQAALTQTARATSQRDAAKRQR